MIISSTFHCSRSNTNKGSLSRTVVIFHIHCVNRLSSNAKRHFKALTSYFFCFSLLNRIPLTLNRFENNRNSWDGLCESCRHQPLRFVCSWVLEQEEKKQQQKNRNNKRRGMSDFTQQRTCSPRLCTNFATQALSFVQRSVCVCIFKHICITQQYLLRDAVKQWQQPWVLKTTVIMGGILQLLDFRPS